MTRDQRMWRLPAVTAPIDMDTSHNMVGIIFGFWVVFVCGMKYVDELEQEFNGL